MSPLKRLTHSSAFQDAVGTTAAWYLRFVWRTNRVTLDPPDIYEQVQIPAIIAMWHGQHFMAPFINDCAARARGG